MNYYGDSLQHEKEPEQSPLSGHGYCRTISWYFTVSPLEFRLVNVRGAHRSVPQHKRRNMFHKAIILPALVVAGLGTSSLAWASSITVNAADNIYGAGQSSAPGGGNVPGFIALSLSATSVTFSSITGSFSCGSVEGCITLNGGTLNDPDGQMAATGSSSNSGSGSISGIAATWRWLSGGSVCRSGGALRQRAVGTRFHGVRLGYLIQLAVSIARSDVFHWRRTDGRWNGPGASLQCSEWSCRPLPWH